MHRFGQKVKKFATLVAFVALLAQLLAPYLSVLPQIAYAQEATVTPTDAPTPTDTVTPTPDESITPTDTPTPTDTTIVPPTDTPTETVSPTPDTSVGSQSDQSSSSSNQTSSPVPQVSAPVNTSTTTPTSTNIDLKPNDAAVGNLSVAILDNISAVSLDSHSDLLASNTQSSASLTTDKLDYAPTDTVLVTGTGLAPSIPYTLLISSTDPPAVNFSKEVTTNDQGVFVYAYQLDGNYRPNYQIALKDSVGSTVAAATFTDSPSATTTLSNVACVQDQPSSPSGLNCTANDISIASVSSITINGHGCRFPGDTVSFTANWQVQSNATSRYNVGLWFATGGQSSALHGSCSATSLPSSPSPFFDGGTSCGGINSGGTGTISITQTATCNPDSNGFLKLPYCTTWQQNGNSACTTPTDAVPGTASKCNCQDGFTIPITIPPAIEVVKTLSPSNDPGKFNLQVNGSTAGTGANVGNGGTTGKIGVAVGSNTIGETGQATSLSNYNSSVSCVLRGTSTVVNTTGTNPWTLNVTNGQDIVCTITNTRINNASITVVKDAQPNNSQSFGFATTGGLTPSTFNLVDNGGTNSTTYSNLASGNYSISENSATDWTLSNVSCMDNSTHQSVSTPTATGTGTIALGSGQNVTCTFTNTRDTGTLQVLKNVDLNGDGDYTDPGETGATDWLWQANAGANHNSGDAAITVNTGNYVLTETQKTNFHQISLLCTGGTLTGNSVAVTKGANVICTFSNARDTGTVIIHKDVQGPAGQDITDTSHSFGVRLDNGASQSITDGGVITINNVLTGTHTVTEDAPPSGYTLFSITPDSDNGTAGAQVSVTSGQTTNVYVVNRQQNATVTIHKNVINPDGADISDTHSFTVQRDSTDPKTIAEGTDATYSLAPGTYNFTENTDPNYTLDSITGDNDSNASNGAQVVLAAGGTASLTFVNKQKKATITVVKNVVNSDGQTDVSDNHTFTVTVGGTQKSFSEGSSAVFSVNPGTYDAVEQSEPNYTLVSNDGPKTVGSNASATITIVNKQSPGSILGTKFDENGNVLSDWTINLFTCTNLGIGCSNSALSTTLTLSDGTYLFDNLLTGFYRVSEVMQAGWINVSALFHDISLSAGTISSGNDFVNKGNLSITACKYESLNGTRDSQTVPVTNWTFSLGDKSQNTGEESNCTTFTDLKPGDYTVSELPLPDGWSIADGSDGTKNVTLTSENETVNFYNFRNGSITGIKWNDIDGNGRRCSFSEQIYQSSCEDTLSNWTIFIDANGDGSLDNGEQSVLTDANGSYAFSNLTPGTYKVCEVMEPGWEQTYPVNSTDSLCHNVVVTSGSTSSGNDFGNRALAPVITIAKANNKEGIDQAPGDSVVYTLTLTVSEGTAGDVTVKDLLPSGFKYKAGSWNATLNGSPISIPEPVYHSPGTWQVGTMNPGDTVVLSYTADIDGSQDPGLYKDVAWAQGTSPTSETVLASAQPTGFVDTNFVGTEVNVVKDQQNSASIAVNTKSVLGASTILPSTGADDIWAILASALLIIGLVLGSAGYILHKRNV